MLLTDEMVEELYVRWLKGEPLRPLARSVEPRLSHNVLINRFHRKYGKQACNLTMTSLSRSLLADYPDDPEVLELALSLIGTPESTKHRSGHSIQQLTRFQTPTKDGILDTIAVSASDPWDYVETSEQIWDYLRLPWLIRTVTCLVEDLALALDTDGLTRDILTGGQDR